MHNDLKKLIQIAGAGLEIQDRYILGSVAANNTVYNSANKTNGGILRFKSEHFYQHIIACSLMSSFPYVVYTEKIKRFDLVLCNPADNTPFTYIEMKRWMSNTGKIEIDPIREDIVKLREIPSQINQNKMLVILSANPKYENNKSKTDENLCDLSKELGLQSNPNLSIWESYRFETINESGEEVEFWIAGCEIF